MSIDPRWIPPRAIIDLHQRQIEEHGGLPGMQSQAQLESALARAQQIHSYGGGDIDMATLAAAYAWGIAKNHPFVDGNKRMALVAIYVFLALNGYYLDAKEEDAYLAMMSLASGAMSEADLIAWVRANSLPAGIG